MTTRWEYTLTPEEEKICYSVGIERQKPYLDNPEKNRNYFEGNFYETLQHQIAAASELASARMFGRYDFVPHVNKWKTQEDIPGYEIRYVLPKEAYHSQQYALRFNTRIDDPQAVYILLIEGVGVKSRRRQEDGWVGKPFKAIGWLYGYEAVSPEFASNFGDHIYQVPRERLWPMSALGLGE